MCTLVDAQSLAGPSNEMQRSGFVTPYKGAFEPLWYHPGVCMSRGVAPGSLVPRCHAAGRQRAMYGLEPNAEDIEPANEKQCGAYVPSRLLGCVEFVNPLLREVGKWLGSGWCEGAGLFCVWFCV